jgi:hypothetical protein
LNFLKLDVLWYFKVKHKVLKNSLHGHLWSDFEKDSLKISGKTWLFFKWVIKNSTRQIPVIPGKNQNHKSQFSDEFYSRLLISSTHSRSLSPIETTPVLTNGKTR